MQIVGFFHEAAHLYQLRFNGFKYIYDTELWIYDLLKATTDDAPDEDRTGDTSAQSPMRYQLRQSAPYLYMYIIILLRRDKCV